MEGNVKKKNSKEANYCDKMLQTFFPLDYVSEHVYQIMQSKKVTFHQRKGLFTCTLVHPKSGATKLSCLNKLTSADGLKPGYQPQTNGWQ